MTYLRRVPNCRKLGKFNKILQFVRRVHAINGVGTAANQLN